MTSLADVCELIVDCEHKTAPKAASGYPMVRTTDIELGTLNFRSAFRVDEAAYRAWTLRAVPRPGDLILAREAPVGNVGIIPPGFEPCLGQRTVLLRPNRQRIEPTFLNYLLSGPDLRSRMDALSNGATVPHLNMRDIRLLELPPLPPLPRQRWVGSALSAYDDLIENNSRRTQILEEMAQAIYREWFVEFRFPGHEDVRMVDSNLGPIPEGWQIETFSNLAEFVNGYAFKPSDWGAEGLPIVKIRELKDGVLPGTPRHPAGRLPAKYLVKSGDLLFSWSADLEAYIWPHGEAWLNQHLFIVEPRPSVSKLFLFHSLRARMQEFRSRAAGTTMRHIKRAALAQVKTVVPTDTLLSRFTTIVSPIDDLRLNLTGANEALRATRDLLLPRLISGEIDVSDLDIGNAEPAA